jgi:hypothetical protein
MNDKSNSFVERSGTWVVIQFLLMIISPAWAGRQSLFVTFESITAQ